MADAAARAAAGLAAGRTVGVVGPLSRSFEQHGRYFNLGLSLIVAELHKRGVPYTIHYREDSSDIVAGEAT